MSRAATLHVSNYFSKTIGEPFRLVASAEGPAFRDRG